MTTTASKPNLSDFFDPKVINRGKQLYNRDHVLRYRLKSSDQQGHEIAAVVMGSQGAAYDVSVSIEDEHVYSHCECFYAINCKHAVAAYYAALAEIEKAEQAPSIDDWLDKLHDLTNDAPIPAKGAERKIHYLLDLSGPSPGFSIAEQVIFHKTGSRFIMPWEPETSELDQMEQHSTDRYLMDFFNFSERFYSLKQKQFTRISTVLAAPIVQMLVRTGSCSNQSNSQLLQWQDSMEALSFEWRSNAEDRYQYTAMDENQRPFDQWIPGTPALFVRDNTVGPLQSDLNFEAMLAIRSMPMVAGKDLGRTKAHLSYFGLVPKQKLHAPETSEEEHSFDEPDGTICVNLVGIQTRVNGVLPAIKLSALYGPKRYALNSIRVEDEHYSRPDITEENGQLLAIMRDKDLESKPKELLKHLDFGCFDYEGDSELVWVPNTVNPIAHLKHWHKSLEPLKRKITEQAWQLEIDPSYQSEQRVADFSGKISESASGWFDLSFAIDIDGLSISSQELISLWLQAGSPENLPVQTDDAGWSMVNMASVKPMINTLFELYDGAPISDKLRIPSFRAFELSEGAFDEKEAPALRRMRKDFAGFAGITEAKPSKKLQASLRDYQQKGLNWLQFLFRYQFGGILADDMGLGKTLQTLAFIQKLKSGRKLKNVALIVAPTSVLWNWASECERFTPNLSYMVFHGSDRFESSERLQEVDLIITSYALAHRDCERFKSMELTLIVLDEAQNIKNASAKRTQAVKTIPAQMKLALTGTPLENNLGELWSIMDFALPGLLGSRDQFRQRFRLPIERFGQPEVNQILSQKIAPFMLRRTKELVAKELPPKTEIIQKVHLLPEQRNLYEGVRISMEQKVRKLIQEKGAARSHIEFLDALLKLRQTCIAPQIVKLSQAKQVNDSAKLEWLAETLPELVNEGKKVLVFSQFTQVLRLIESLLEKAKIPWVKLTGQTRRRQEAIDQFQQGEVPIFLISLKAGGAGLNLTAADTVIHVDPWWNPAVENQATDRAYRIGQDKPVFVYKLVAENTVEEKIQQMQQDKQALADTLFDASKQAKLPKSGDELLALLS